MATLTADNLVDRAEIMRLHGGPWKKQGDWMVAFCPVPAHNDGAKHGMREGQSLGLSGAGVLQCFAGCSFKDIMEALRGPGYMRPTAPTPISSAHKLVKVYEYRDVDGTLVGEKGRFEGGGGKSFKWRAPGVTDWPASSGLKMADMPLYGAQFLDQQPTAPVFVVEGEKACEACVEQGLLAVTTAGGAGQKDFGRALEVLAGRVVYLWPDNDNPGRQLMTLLQGRLNGVAKAIHVVAPTGPEKSDAFDYFEGGGKVADLLTEDTGEPVVKVLATDRIEVKVPSMVGPVLFTFADMEKVPDHLDTELTITFFGNSKYPYTENINILSPTARTNLRRELENLYPMGGRKEDSGWGALLNIAFSLAKDTFLRLDRAIDLWDIPASTAEMFLIPPYVMADGPTIIFGDGSAGKSYIAFLMAMCVGWGMPFCGISAPMVPVMVIDYEDSSANFKRRMGRLAEGMGVEVGPGAVHYWDAQGIPLKDQIDAIKRKVEKDGIGLLIIDSAAPACGGPPEDSVAALALFRALKKVPCPAIIIAHVNKSGDADKPFGSVFWHNEARRTWFVSRVQETESDEIDVGFYCRKVNDGRKPRDTGFHITFEGMDGPVRVRSQALEEIPELQSRTDPKNQVWGVLTRPLTIAQIVEETGLKQKTVESILNRSTSFVKAGADTDKPGRAANLWGRRAMNSQ